MLLTADLEKSLLNHRNTRREKENCRKIPNYILTFCDSWKFFCFLFFLETAMKVGSGVEFPTKRKEQEKNGLKKYK